VASYCNTTANGLGAYSTPLDFTTLTCSNPCLPPTGLATTNITQTTAVLTWISSTTALASVVQYRPVTIPESSWITLNATSSPATLANLTCGTVYQWRVASYCGNSSSGLSSYSTPVSFTTLVCTTNNCSAPTGLTSTITSTNPFNIMLQWNANNAISYNIRYEKVNATVYTLTTSTTNSKIPGQLTSGQYIWQVQSVCSNNSGTPNISAWSNPAYFAVAGPVIVFPNPVVSDVFHMQIELEKETSVNIVISDQFGNTVKMLNKTLTPDAENLDIDAANLKNGIYFVQIKGDNLNEFHKVIIMR
jgi:hypothetical protein